MLLLFLAMQAAEAPADVPADPVAHLRGLVVDNIRHCPKAAPGETVVCSRDRGFAESYRLPKLDPRFEHPAPPPADALAGVGAIGPNVCNNVGAVGATGCALGQYNQWGGWKKGEKAKGRDFPW